MDLESAERTRSAPFRQEFVYLLERDAWLDGEERELLAEVDDPVHPTEIEDDGSVDCGNLGAEPPVLSSAHGA